MKDGRVRIAIGLMSGTSADGVDAVACRVRGRGTRMRVARIVHVHTPYPSALRRELLAVMAPAATRTESLCRLDVEIGEMLARAALRVMRRARLRPEDVAAIGSHGQTICHRPRHGATLQIGRAAVIAARTGCAVVSDFRSADLAAGGQGAPLVPWTDWLLFRSPRRARIIQNIGGIANLTWLPAGARPDEVIAFDTGPGNMVMDALADTLTRGRRAFDAAGRMAARGRICDAVLAEWLAHPYFRRLPPKSCGREEFGRQFVRDTLRRHARRLSPDDWLATATTLTVESIHRACRRFLPHRDGRPAADDLILCGGGAKNATLRRWIARRFAGAAVTRIERFGIASSAKEALSFALLALACLDGVPANLPQVTGAARPVVLGQITPAGAAR